MALHNPTALTSSSLHPSRSSHISPLHLPLLLHAPRSSLPGAKYSCFLRQKGQWEWVNHSRSPHSSASCGEFQTRISSCFMQKTVKWDRSPTDPQITTSGTKISAGIHWSEGLKSQGSQNSLNKISDPPHHNFCLFVFFFLTTTFSKKHISYCNSVTHIYVCYWNPYLVQCPLIQPNVLFGYILLYWVSLMLVLAHRIGILNH